MTVTFVVSGVPVPQAGTRGVPTAAGNRQITTGGKGLARWRSAVTAAAMQARCAHGQQTGAIHLDATFRFTVPKSRARNAPRIARKMTKPDLDKLVRAIGDSLTAAGLIIDDNQIASIQASKWETTTDEPGVVITLTELS